MQEFAPYTRRDRFFDLLGWAGMAGLVICHVLLSLRILEVNVFYQCLQILSAGSLGVAAGWKRFYPTVGLEIFWVIISVFSIVSYSVTH